MNNSHQPSPPTGNGNYPQPPRSTPGLNFQIQPLQYSRPQFLQAQPHRVLTEVENRNIFASGAIVLPTNAGTSSSATSSPNYGYASGINNSLSYPARSSQLPLQRVLQQQILSQNPQHQPLLENDQQVGGTLSSPRGRSQPAAVPTSFHDGFPQAHEQTSSFVVGQLQEDAQQAALNDDPLQVRVYSDELLQQQQPRQSRKRCRICLLEEGETEDTQLVNTNNTTSTDSFNDENALISPCLCHNFNSRFVHRRCLDAWRVNGTSYNAAAFTHCCECSFEYQLRLVTNVTSNGEREQAEFRKKILKKSCFYFWLFQLVVILSAVVTAGIDIYFLHDELRKAFPAWIRRNNFEEEFFFGRKGVYYVYGLVEILCVVLLVYSVYGWYRLLKRLIFGVPSVRGDGQPQQDSASVMRPVIGGGNGILAASNQLSPATPTCIAQRLPHGQVPSGGQNVVVGPTPESSRAQETRRAADEQQNNDQHPLPQQDTTWLGSRAFVLRPQYQRFQNRYRWNNYRWRRGRFFWGPPRPFFWFGPRFRLLFAIRSLFCCFVPRMWVCCCNLFSCCCCGTRGGRAAASHRGIVHNCAHNTRVLFQQYFQENKFLLLILAIGLAVSFTFMGFVTGLFLLLTAVYQVYLDYLRIGQIQVLSQKYIVEDLSRFHEDEENFPNNLAEAIGMGRIGGNDYTTTALVSNHQNLASSTFSSTSSHQHHPRHPAILPSGSALIPDDGHDDENSIRPSAPPIENEDLNRLQLIDPVHQGRLVHEFDPETGSIQAL
ncbi:unnamed protein product [Amoebophrya sp. A120]|nr:unnamed protein product [Amoebophrya sp. A120]|eukprot:GSA120T00019850001.1